MCVSESVCVCVCVCVCVTVCVCVCMDYACAYLWLQSTQYVCECSVASV